MKSSRKYLFLLIACSLTVAVIAAGFLSVGSWLEAGDAPEKAEALIVLAGEPARAVYSADLYNQGFAHNVYVSRPVRERGHKMLEEYGIFILRAEDIYKQILVKKGVPESSIHFFGKASVSTVEEAEIINGIFHGPQCHILVVTSPFHVRRVKMIFKNNVKKCVVSVVGNPYEDFPEKWWTNQDSARNVLLEVAKIVFYKIGGQFHSAQSAR